MGRSTSDPVSSTASLYRADALDHYASQGHVSDLTRIVMLHGEINEVSVAGVITQLLQLAGQNNKPIHLVVSTYGGAIDEMFSLYDAIKFLPCPVHTVGLGKVMSAGVLLLAAGEKGNRSIGRSSRIMLHPVSGGAIGNVFEIVNETNEHQRLQQLMTTALQRETKMLPRQLQRIMRLGHDCYLTPDEAINLGIADRVIGSTTTDG